MENGVPVHSYSLISFASKMQQWKLSIAGDTLVLQQDSIPVHRALETDSLPENANA